MASFFHREKSARDIIQKNVVYMIIRTFVFSDFDSYFWKQIVILSREGRKTVIISPKKQITPTSKSIMIFKKKRKIFMHRFNRSYTNSQ